MKNKILFHFIFNSFIICSINFELTLAEINLDKGHGHTCDRLLRAFKQNATLFIDHSIENAVKVPAKMCTESRLYFVNVTESYKDLTTSTLLNVSCKGLYFDNDRLNIVETLYDYVQGLWQKANCDECYFNGTLTNVTRKFELKNEEFINCTKSNVHTECEACDSIYTNLNSIYNFDVKKKPNDKVCFDVEDMMNRSRSHWSKDLNCCSRERNLNWFAGATSGFALLPLIFYCGMYYYTKRKEMNETELLSDSEIRNNPNTLPTMSEEEEQEDSNEIEAGPSNERLNKSSYKKNFETSSKLSASDNDDGDDEDPIIKGDEATNFLNLNNEKNIVNEKFLNIKIGDNDFKNTNVISAEVHGESTLIKLN